MINPLTYFRVSTTAPAVTEHTWSVQADRYVRTQAHPTASRVEAIALCVAWNVALKWHFKCNEQARLLRGIPVHKDKCAALVIVWQPGGSYCCGQCCLAMVAGVSLERAKRAVGRKGSTSTKALQKGLIALGMRPRGGRLRAIRGDLAKLPEICILKVATPWRISGWHWVLKHGKKVYDPSRGLFMVAEYTAETYNHITSYLEIFTDGGPAPRPAPGGGSDDLIPQKGHVVAEHGSFKTIGVDCPACGCHTKFDVGTGCLEHNFRAVCYVCHRDITSIVKTRLMAAKVGQGPWPTLVCNTKKRRVLMGLKETLKEIDKHGKKGGKVW